MSKNDQYIECVQDIDKLMGYDTKLAAGIIQQVWCLNSFDRELSRILDDFKVDVKNTYYEDFSKTFDIEFQSTSEASRFKHLVSMSRQIRVYTTCMSVDGQLYPKPNQESVNMKRDFLVKENCESLNKEACKGVTTVEKKRKNSV